MKISGKISGWLWTIALAMALAAAGVMGSRAQNAASDSLAPVDLERPAAKTPAPAPSPAPGDTVNPPPAPVEPYLEAGGAAGNQEPDQTEKDDPERTKRLIRIKELALEYRTTDDEQRKQEIEKELRPLVDQELRYQQEQSKKRIAQLEARLDRMKKVIEDREENWDKVVDFTMDEITGKNAYLKSWKPGKKDPEPEPEPKP